MKDELGKTTGETIKPQEKLKSKDEPSKTNQKPTESELPDEDQFPYEKILTKDKFKELN